MRQCNECLRLAATTKNICDGNVMQATLNQGGKASSVLQGTEHGTCGAQLEKKLKINAYLFPGMVCGERLTQLSWRFERVDGTPAYKV